MIPRYRPDKIASLFDERAQWSYMLEVELLAVEAWAQVGVVPSEDADEVRKAAPTVDSKFIADIDERELVTMHDVAAFVDVVQNRIGGSAGKWVHYGLTSSDVIDTALCARLTKAADLLIEVQTGLISTLKRRAFEFRDTATVGRTHGIHAEPTTFGFKLGLWALQANRDLRRLRQARETIAVGKLSGAVGTYSNVDPHIEAYVCQKLGLEAVPATQVISRDRHAELLWACAAVGTTLEMIATEIRHLQRTEVGEVNERFGKGQKGSSAMPHKRNPVMSERVCGLARVLRGYLTPAMDNVALWHERDISHSSAERIVLPDATVLTYYLIESVTKVIDGLVVYEDRMLENLNERSYGLVFSQPVLLALIESGMTRDDAYRVVQAAARIANEERRPFREVLERDESVTIDATKLDQAFDVHRSLRHIGALFEKLEAI